MASLQSEFELTAPPLPADAHAAPSPVRSSSGPLARVRSKGSIVRDPYHAQAAAAAMAVAAAAEAQERVDKPPEPKPPPMAAPIDTPQPRTGSETTPKASRSATANASAARTIADIEEGRCDSGDGGASVHSADHGAAAPRRVAASVSFQEVEGVELHGYDNALAPESSFSSSRPRQMSERI